MKKLIFSLLLFPIFANAGIVVAHINKNTKTFKIIYNKQTQKYSYAVQDIEKDSDQFEKHFGHIPSLDIEKNFEYYLKNGEKPEDCKWTFVTLDDQE